MIEFKNVSVKYRDGAGGTEALNEITLRISDGEFVFVVGGSGAGKSTLLKLLTCEKQPTTGRVFVDGYNLGKVTRRQIPVYRRNIGMVFQDFRLIPGMTVYENVAFVLRCTDRSGRYIRSRVPYVLDLVKLSHKAKAYPSQLSGGEQQRVAIARAFAADPKYIIADEPTGNVDPALSYEIVELLKNINAQGETTVIMVTHEHELVKYFGGRTVSLIDGQITFDDYIEPK